MTLTPFEQVHKNMAALGIRMAESLAVDNMITQAQAYELDTAKLGGGVPPLSETTTIHLMWAAVGEFTLAEA